MRCMLHVQLLFAQAKMALLQMRYSRFAYVKWVRRQPLHLYLHVVRSELVSPCVEECLWGLNVPATGALVLCGRGHALSHS